MKTAVGGAVFGVVLAVAGHSITEWQWWLLMLTCCALCEVRAAK